MSLLIKPFLLSKSLNSLKKTHRVLTIQGRGPLAITIGPLKTVRMQLHFSAVYYHQKVSSPISYITSPDAILSFPETPPGVLVTVNFTELGIQSDTINNVAKNSVQVMYGLVNRTELVVENTLPVTLIPGMNAFAMANIAIRRQFRRSALSTFGLSDASITFYIIARLTYFFSSPGSPMTLFSFRKSAISYQILLHHPSSLGRQM